MKRKTFRIVIVVLLAIFLIGTVTITILGIDGPAEIKGGYATYKCDVKNLRLATTIEITQDEKKVGTVSGNVLTFVTDPLTLTSPSGNKLAYAGDDYHFFAQDSHAIYVDEGLAVEMVGLVKWFGEEYDIYDINENKIANVKFNALNTAGEMYDTSGKLIATYDSNFFFNDYDVRISEDCKIDDNAVLMIFASYYSDQAADSRSSSSSHSSNNK